MILEQGELGGARASSPLRDAVHLESKLRGEAGGRRNGVRRSKLIDFLLRVDRDWERVDPVRRLRCDARRDASARERVARLRVLFRIRRRNRRDERIHDARARKGNAKEEKRGEKVEREKESRSKFVFVFRLEIARARKWNYSVEPSPRAIRSIIVTHRTLYLSQLLAIPRAQNSSFPSEIREIPDSQEVHLSETDDTSIILEVLESVTPADSIEAIT